MKNIILLLILCPLAHAQDTILSYDNVIKSANTAKVSYDLNIHDYNPYKIVHIIRNESYGKVVIVNDFYVLNNGKCIKLLSVESGAIDTTCALINSQLYILKIGYANNTVSIINKDIDLNAIDKLHKKISAQQGDAPEPASPAR